MLVQGLETEISKIKGAKDLCHPKKKMGLNSSRPGTSTDHQKPTSKQRVEDYSLLNSHQASKKSIIQVQPTKKEPQSIANLSEGDEISLVELSDGGHSSKKQHFIKNIASNRIKKIIEKTEIKYDPKADW